MNRMNQFSRRNDSLARMLKVPLCEMVEKVIQASLIHIQAGPEIQEPCGIKHQQVYGKNGKVRSLPLHLVGAQ
jgi:hypothetical protein